MSTVENDFDIEDLTIYPNPIRSIAYIEFELDQQRQIKVFDLSGKAILSDQLPPGHAELSLLHLSKGTYMLTVGTDQIIGRYKVIKE